MLADPLNAEILGAMAGEPLRPGRRGTVGGGTAQRPDDANPKYRITPAGGEALAVRKRIDAWLARHPLGELPGSGDAAGEAIEALAESWASMILHTLAAGPRTVAELREAVEDTDRVAIEHLLETMRRLAMLERLPGEHGEASYAITDWLREGMGPLAAAARLERRHNAAEATPIEPLDVTVAFQLALPLLRLPGEYSGSCALAVEVSGDLAGATARVEEGRVVECEPSPRESGVDASCTGDIRAWFRAVIDGGVKRMEVDGNRHLAQAVIKGLHERFFAHKEL